MQDRDSIRRRPEETPAGKEASRAHVSSIPYDLLREASGRLRILALIVGALWIIGISLDHVVARQPNHGAQTSPMADVIAAVTVAMSLALFWWAGREGQNPRHTLDVGLAYMVFTALALGFISHWDHLPPGIPIRPMISWNGVLILMFAAIVPSSPLRMGIAGTVAAFMNPVSMLVSRSQGLWEFQPTGLVFEMHFPDFLLVGVAATISHVVTRLGRQVGKAREMGSYKLTRMLGKGGMGEVWEARHRMLARDAAIKLIQPELLAQGSGRKADQLQRRFEQEATMTASLRSPHTVELYDFGVTEGGVFYYVMELLQGIDLATLVTNFGPQPPARVIAILSQVCLSLEEAHRRNMVHRDIKPNNIFLCRMGTEHDFAKVLDFGLVKALGPQDAAMTAEGGAIGTPDYMAPELALSNENVDGRCDIYGLGCVAYWLLTGRTVFEAKGAMPMMLAHVRESPVSPSEKSGRPVPASLEQIVMQCLGKNPAERPGSAEALGRALNACDGFDTWTPDDAATWWAKHAPDQLDSESLRAHAATLTLGATL